MSLGWLITNFLASFLLPPLNGLVLVAVGWFMIGRYPRFARYLIGLGLVLLWVLALPAIGNALRATLEDHPVTLDEIERAEAIVVLGGGRYRDAPEYGEDTVSDATLARLRYAAKLHRKSGLPILVTGGKPDGDGLSEAEAMARTFSDEFGIAVRWTEGSSDNTHENARHSAAILRAAGIRHVLLVTHAWHMPRSARSFTEAGLDVIPAPTAFSRRPLTPLDFLPSDYEAARHAIHEWIGMLWYRLRAA